MIIRLENLGDRFISSWIHAQQKTHLHQTRLKHDGSFDAGDVFGLRVRLCPLHCVFCFQLRGSARN